MTDIIAIENLTHTFADGSVGLDNVTLGIPAGSFVVIGGRNGSGKTTLLRHLNGLLLPDSGSVKLAGTPITENLAAARQAVGMVFQDTDSQIVGETVYDDVAFGPENLRLSREAVRLRVAGALSAVGLSHLAEQRPHLLSGGQKRRLTIAGILAMEPRVLVFDEPFSNLDYPGIRQVLEQIVSLHRGGHTIILTTHDLEKVIAHADRLILMKGGTVMRDDRPENLFRELAAFGVREPCAFRMGRKTESWLN